MRGSGGRYTALHRIGAVPVELQQLEFVIESWSERGVADHPVGSTHREGDAKRYGGLSHERDRRIQASEAARNQDAKLSYRKTTTKLTSPYGIRQPDRPWAARNFHTLRHDKAGDQRVIRLDGERRYL